MRMLPRRLPPSGLPAPRPCLRLLVLVVLLMDGYVVGYTFQPPLLPSSRSTTSPWPSRRACKLAQPRVGRGVAGARASNVVVMASTSVAASAVGFKKGAPIPAPQYGDTQGAELFLDHVSVAAGANRLISDVDWKVNKGERVGIVGMNGAGKSTLLSVMAGAYLPEEGRVTVHPRATLGYLVQTAVSGSTLALVEEVMSQMTRYHAAKAAVHDAEARVAADPSDANLLALERAQAVLEEAGGNDVERRVDGILGGLGFQRSDYGRPCTDFSGGWQMRIALARLLLGEPSLLLLDEPTNHLDSSAKAWLMHFLATYPGTVLLVSHEEELLRAFKCTTVAEVAHGQLELYRCGYDKFLLQREERTEALAAAAERQRKERERLQGFIDRFGAKATLASSANSRKKQLEKMEIIEGPASEAKRPKLRLPLPPKVMPELVKLVNASFGYPGAAAPLVERLDLTLARGSRLVLLGPNGCGKSTMLKALMGALPPLSGERSLGEGLEMGVFTQDLAQDLPQDAIALEHVLATVRQRDVTISDQQARAALGALGLTGEKAMRPIGALSGGEKARVALSVFALLPHNLLVLDEPSNHLDVATTEVLTNALAEFPGTLVVISHNKPFVERLRPTHIGLIRNRRLVVEERPLRPTDWAFDVEGENAGGAAATGPSKGDGGAAAGAGEEKPQLSYAEQRARFKKISAAPKRIAKLQELLEGKEAKAEEYDREMYKNGADAGRVMELSERRDALASEIEGLYAEWEELELLVAEAEAEKK